MGQRLQKLVEVSWAHVAILLLLCTYIVLGAFVFRYLDPVLAEKPFCEIIFFTFITITSIGWGNMCPAQSASRVFCMVYAIFGIPLSFLALANCGQLVAEAYWMVVDYFSETRESVDRDRRLPLFLVFVLLVAYTFMGGMIFHLFENKLPLATALYFSFTSFSTIGYGDHCVWVGEDYGRMGLVVAYLAVGMVLMSTFMGALNGFLNHIHYLGRSFSGASDVDVWFGGQRLTVTELLELVADQFQVSAGEIETVLHDLDNIIAVACEQTAPTRQTSFMTMVTGSPSVSSQNLAQDPPVVRSTADATMSPSVKHQLLSKIKKPNLKKVEEEEEENEDDGRRRRSLKATNSSRPAMVQRAKSWESDERVAAVRKDSRLFNALGMFYNMTHQPATSSPRRPTT